MGNPFYDHLDWSFQGKYCRVYGEERVYHGWVEVMHHSQGAVIMHGAFDVTEDETRRLGSVYVSESETIEVLHQHKRIEALQLKYVVDSQFLTESVEPTDYHMRRAYRNGFAGSFPVVRPVHTDEESVHYELINGHKRVAALRRVGIEKHPFEVFPCEDEVARELFTMAHREQKETSGIPAADQTSLDELMESIDKPEQGDSP